MSPRAVYLIRDGRKCKAIGYHVLPCAKCRAYHSVEKRGPRCQKEEELCFDRHVSMALIHEDTADALAYERASGFACEYNISTQSKPLPECFNVCVLATTLTTL